MSNPPRGFPRSGPFSSEFLQRMRSAPAGTSPETVIAEMLRSITPNQLKDAVTRATPQERNLLFNAIPNNQIKSILGSLPSSVLAPAVQPTAPLPAPTAGPPASILQTTYANVPYPPAESDPNWAQKISNGKTVNVTLPFSSPVLEWTSVYDPGHEKEGSLNNPMVGLTGWVVEGVPPISQHNVWFVHPFGRDFQYYIVPDPQYENLLAASNVGVNLTDPKDEYAVATLTGRGLGLDAPKGVIGVETDQGLVPPSFQSLVTKGTRIATFGRWIVDCGHSDFHSEIHAPFLMAVAKPAPAPNANSTEMTSVHLMSRPYTVSQLFSEGNFVDHLLAEIAKVEAILLGIPLSTRVEAHPTVFTTPYEGRSYIKLLVQPPVKKPTSRVTVTQQRLMVSFHFTHRAGVSVQVFDAGNDTVGIIIVLGDLSPAQLPPKHDLTVQWSELGSDYPKYMEMLQIADILTLPGSIAAYFLNKGILTDIYDPPSASSPLDNQNVVTPVGIGPFPAGAGVSEDDNQPFPIYGWLNVWWQKEQILA
jgi:hypothetical protein